MTQRKQAPLLSRQREVVRKENFGRRRRVSLHRSLRRNSKQWQSTLLLPLLLFLSSVPQLKHLPLDVLVFSCGATGAVTTIVSLAHVVKSFVKTMARRVTLRETAKHQPNQPIKLPERMSVRPTTVGVKSRISNETAPRQQQLATAGEF